MCNDQPSTAVVLKPWLAMKVMYMDIHSYSRIPVKYIETANPSVEIDKRAYVYFEIELRIWIDEKFWAFVQNSK